MLFWNKKSDIEKIKNSLKQDQILLATSDTVLGLFGALTKKSYLALNAIKQRHDRPYLIMIHSTKLLPFFINQPINEKLQEIINLCWPGPVTLVFKAQPKLPDFLKNHDQTIALRIPYHEGLLTLLSSFNGLFSTSANIHHQSIPSTLADVDHEILKKVANVCTDQPFKEKNIGPSTILDCSSPQIKIIRQGYPLNQKIMDLIKNY
ncbi:L-threonylcarbamoyladenylate synthase [Candidatus Dependentiae bacterium]|nr:L-threonylcarbamoyladenylate synthase [Candidatus Dependentiae bacterium]